MIFFYGLFVAACAPEGEKAQLEWEDGRAVSVLWSGESHPEVYLAGSRTQQVLGRWEADPRGHRFIPLAGFNRGLTYYLLEANGDSTALVIPALEGLVPAGVVAVYPTADSLPSNLLKMYLQFSAPMQYAGHPLDHILVRDLSSDSLVQPFLRLETGLWNAQQTELTLWLDPGRIKTDLIPNRELGIPLVPGHRYRMELGEHFRSADGRQLEPQLLKEWIAGPADRTKPDPGQWEVRLPQAGTLKPLALHFGESLDAVLLRESLWLKGPGGQPVAGNWEIGPMESSIAFKPAINWNKGEYAVYIASILEDVAGNNLKRLFDSDLQGDTRAEAAESFSLTFTLP